MGETVHKVLGGQGGVHLLESGLGHPPIHGKSLDISPLFVIAGILYVKIISYIFPEIEKPKRGNVTSVF